MGAAALTLAAVAYGNLIGLMPQDLRDFWYVPLNLAVGLGLGAVALWWLRLDAQGLGLARASLTPGLRWGTALGLALVAPLFLALAIPPLHPLLADARVEGLDAGEVAYRALVRIPLGSALFEEWLFRGVLYAAWLRAMGLRGALFGSSAGFGLWHIRSSLELLQTNQPDTHLALVALFVVGATLATAVGGLLFVALRLRTGGILAPVLTHGLISSLALVAAYLAS